MKTALLLIFFTISSAEAQVNRLLMNAAKPQGISASAPVVLSGLPTKESDAAIEKTLQEIAQQTTWFKELKISVNAGAVA